MKLETFRRIEELQEKLAEVVLIEADPVNWTGGDVLPKDLTQEERGDRYWCKKNAAATMSLLTKACSLMNFDGKHQEPPEQTDDNPELDKQVASAEKDAMRLLDKFNQRFGKTH